MPTPERMEAIRAELRRRGVPDEQIPQGGQQVGQQGRQQGFSPMRGLRAGLQAFPSLAMGKMPPTEKEAEPSFYEKEIFKQRLKGTEEEKELTPGQTLKNLKDSAKLKLVQGAPVEDLTEEEKATLGETELKKFAPRLGMAPEFTPGTGGAISRVKSFLSPQQAELDEDSIFAINKIETEQDLQEFMRDYKNGLIGENIYKTVMEYFQKTPEE